MNWISRVALANDQLGIIKWLEFVAVIEFQIDAAATVVLRVLVDHEITITTPRSGLEEIKIRPSETMPTKTVTDRKDVGHRLDVPTWRVHLHRHRQLETQDFYQIREVYV